MNSKPVTNADVARALRELSMFLEMQDVQFKPRAFEKAAFAVEAAERPVAELYADKGVRGLEKLPSIGHGTATRIAELVDTGRIEDLEKERQKLPVDVLALTSIQGVGPKTVRALYDALEVHDVDELEQVARAGRVRAVPEFGEKSEENILRGIEVYRASHGRRPLGQVVDLVAGIEERLHKLPGVRQVAVAGSVRRRRDTVGDVDLLVASSQPGPVMAAFTTMPEVVRIYAQGETKTSVRLSAGIDADLRVVEPESFGAALQYFTGSKAHNVALRRIARQNGLKLSEYGLFRRDRMIAARTEEEIYEALGLRYVPPEMREDTGEIEAAREGRLPRLIRQGALRGDLQVHSNWTDGSASIEEMAEAARSRGLEYIAITDHTRDLAMTGGLDEHKLARQLAEIRRLDKRLEGIRVFAGVEVNIRADGSLDVSDDILARLDVVGAAIHSHFDQSRDEMTRRLLRALENPHVGILFHPMARALGRRPAVQADWGQVIEAARRTGTVLEIDAQPERLDLPDEWVRRAVDAGVRLAIDSDAHRPEELRYASDFGIGVARRGWAKRGDVLNAAPSDRVLEQLRCRPAQKTPRRGRRQRRRPGPAHGAHGVPR